MLRLQTSEDSTSTTSLPESAAGAYALRLAGWPDDRPVWTGSPPCQPLSGAGRRKGHADKRHLWPAFHRLIAQRRPAIVFGEQVAGGDGLEWLAGVRADLEATGYAVGAANLCAAGVRAPHNRPRLYFAADAGPFIAWPTPTLSMSQPGANVSITGMRPNGTHATASTQFVARRISGLSSRPLQGGDLSPAHSCWLMGFPPAWLSCTPLETPSCRKSQRNSSALRSKPSGPKGTVAMSDREQARREPHPLANIFPMMDKAALAELAADIKTESQREPITLWQDQIIDGRNRYAACDIAGVEPIFKRIDFPGGDAEALAYVLSRNLKRRHLTVAQRSVIAAKVATLRKGSNQHTAGAVSSTQTQAAEMLKVSVDSVQRARVVLDHGSPGLVAAVEAGETSLRKAAETARRDAEPQAPSREAIEAISEAISEANRQKALKADLRTMRREVRTKFRILDDAEKRRFLAEKFAVRNIILDWIVFVSSRRIEAA